MHTNFVIMGLPSSGKTTFLAALWHLVESGETSCRLRLARYEGDLAYLTTIAEAWRTFQRVPRTSQIGDADITISLIDRESGVGGTAFFPDLAGETFDVQVEARHCRPEYIKELSEEDGILFFVTADRREDELSIVELNRRLPNDEAQIADADPENGDGGIAPSVAPERTAEWHPKYVPAQVKVVQLLSDLMRWPFAVRRRRIAMIISAWDLARGMELTPEGWLATHMPLVSQVLRANAELFEHAVYGVSAQGVSLADERATDEAARITPSRRIQIVGPQGAAHDLTLPLVWLMSRG